MIFGRSSFFHGFILWRSEYSSVKTSEKPELLPKDKKIILYCAKGILSYEAAEELEEKGYDVAHLAGGYGAWLLGTASSQETISEIEKKYQSQNFIKLFQPFLQKPITNMSL